MNEQMADAQSRYNGRIRWMASLPWQYAADAVAVLKRAHAAGAVGVITLANIAGAPRLRRNSRPSGRPSRKPVCRSSCIPLYRRAQMIWI